MRAPAVTAVSTATLGHGTSTMTGGNGAPPVALTVTKGRTTHPMARPSPVPARTATTTTLAFSSQSQPDSWPGESPRARSSANSVRRWRADTAALTARPITANMAATTKPSDSPPIIATASGSVVSRSRVSMRLTIVAPSKTPVAGGVTAGSARSSHHSSTPW